MTTTDLDTPAGDIDSVANSLLLTESDDDQQLDAADDTAQADAEGQATDDVDEAEDQAADDDGDAVGDDGDDAEEDDGKEEQTYRVKADGAEVDVTLDDLKRSYAAQVYHQRRMVEASEIRKEAEVTYHALNQERAQVQQLIDAYQQQLAAAGNPQPPSRDLLKTDPIRYLEEEAGYREQMEQRQMVAQQQAAFAQQHSEQQARAYSAYLGEQAQLLTQRIPEFADAKKAGALKAALIEVGTSYGFSPEEVQGVSDARHVQILHDAMRYRQLVAGKDRVQEKVAAVSRPMVRPGAKRTETDGKKSAEQKSRSRMRSSGSVDDVAAYLLG